MEIDPFADDVERSLCQNYYKLAQAIVALACLDYVMLHHPTQGSKYLSRWYGNGYFTDHNYSWLASQQMQLEECFSNGLGELAIAVGKYDLINLAMHAKVPKHRVEDVLNERNHRGRGLQRT